MKTIYLIRHGQSEANANPDLYLEKDRFDHLFLLSPKGQEQASQCGESLNLKLRSYSVFISPYKRAQETWDRISEHLDYKPQEVTTDVRIREQEYKDFTSKDDSEQKKAKAKARGKLFYRYKHGESGSDIINRVSNFYNQLRMDMTLGNHPDTIVIVCHEIAIRSLLIAMGAESLESFDKIEVDNCQIIKLEASSNLKFRRV